MSDLQISLRLAFRHIDADTTTQAEREALLAMMAKKMPSHEAEVAAQSLHHLREQRKHQLTLKNILQQEAAR